MSTGGGPLMQIAAIGLENNYLSTNPEVTYFINKFKRHTNFSIESIQQQLNDAPLPNNKLTVKIDRKGDLIHKCYLEFTVPEILSANDTAESDIWEANKSYVVDDVVRATSIATAIGQAELIQNIDGAATGYKFGSSVAINNNGTFITVGATAEKDLSVGGSFNIYGAVYVYQLNNEIWTFREVIRGNTHSGKFGSSVGISDDGNRIVVGAVDSHISGGTSNSNHGYVKVYEWDGSNYNLKGRVLVGAANYDMGDKVAISGDGQLVCACATGFSSGKGKVRIFRFDTDWTLVAELDGTQNDARFGKGISISENGDLTNTVFAIGEPSYDIGGLSGGDHGRVHVYNWDPLGTRPAGIPDPGIAGYWELKGPIFEGSEGTFSGQTILGTGIDLTSTGDSIILSEPAADIGGDTNGLVYIYDWNGTSWIQRGDILSGPLFSYFGDSVTISNDSNTVCITGTSSVSNIYNWNINENGGAGAWVQTIPTITPARLGVMSKDGLTHLAGIQSLNSNTGNVFINKLYRSGIYKCIQSGTSNVSEPTWLEITNTTDNSVIWVRYNTNIDGTSDDPFYKSRPITSTQLFKTYDFIDYITVKIEGKTIVKHNSKWMEIWNDLTVPEGKREGLNNLLQIGANSSVRGGVNILRLPLQFWFCKNPSLALPIIALQSEDVTIDIKLKDFISTDLLNLNLWVDYIFLGETERKWFALNNHEYVIDQVQTTGIEYIKNVSKIRLDFNHPVKELIWKLDNNNNHKIKSVGLQLNGEDMFKKKSSEHFSLIQRYNYHTGSNNNNGIYVHSFALSPEDHNPTGSLNFSKIENAELLLTLDSTAIDPNVEIFAVNHNVLSIKNGMGYVKWSS